MKGESFPLSDMNVLVGTRKKIYRKKDGAIQRRLVILVNGCSEKGLSRFTLDTCLVLNANFKHSCVYTYTEYKS